MKTERINPTNAIDGMIAARIRDYLGLMGLKVHDSGLLLVVCPGNHPDKSMGLAVRIHEGADGRIGVYLSRTGQAATLHPRANDSFGEFILRACRRIAAMVLEQIQEAHFAAEPVVGR